MPISIVYPFYSQHESERSGVQSSTRELYEMCSAYECLIICRFIPVNKVNKCSFTAMDYLLLSWLRTCRLMLILIEYYLLLSWLRTCRLTFILIEYYLLLSLLRTCRLMFILIEYYLLLSLLRTCRLTFNQNKHQPTCS